MVISNERGFHVLIPAAGSGSRAGLSVPKQYRQIGGKTILRHTIEKFIGIQGLKSIRVIVDPDHMDLYTEAVGNLADVLAPPVSGATTRKESVYNGLSGLSGAKEDDLVLIHDAARPFITAAAIERLLHAMEQAEAATLAAPVADTLVDAAYTPYDRDRISAVQTPQAFRLGTLRKAHELYREDDRFTDDAGLVAAMGGQVALVSGNRDNFKITTNDDIAMAERLLSPHRETRTGFGYDVHTFDPAPASVIRLGGINIAHDRKLLGHSDADVILHALTDALLGTIGSGDIGQLFPPSDPQWKGADSELFLREAVRLVLEQQGKIVNVDITVIAESPKIGPHRETMQQRIASMLGIPPARVGMKATTAEKLGFVGREEGIVAQAVASVSFPESCD